MNSLIALPKPTEASQMIKPTTIAASLATALALPPSTFASSFPNYSTTSTGVAVYTTLNSVERVSTAARRDPKETVLAKETVCEDWVNRKNYLAVDLYGYLRLLTKETPFTKCTEFKNRTRTDYPQALFVTNTGAERIWDNHIPLMNRVARACGTSEEVVMKWSYQGVDLINGKPAETARSQLSAADWYGNNYRRDTAKGVLRVTSKGSYTLPTGERAQALEYSFDIFQWNTMMPKGSSGGWGNTPLFRLFSGKKAETASSSRPTGSVHSREYAAWFAQNKPTRTACKFLVVDLTDAPRYQEQQSVTSKPEWRTADTGLGPKDGNLPK